MRARDAVRKFGELEAAVMAHLWAHDEPRTVRQTREDLAPERRLAYTTVMTVMDNLHRKGFLTRDQQGRAYLYQPLRSREEHAAALMTEVLDSSVDQTTTLLHFVEQMTPTEVRRLRAAMERRRPPSRRPGRR